jgi:hypothetical protein
MSRDLTCETDVWPRVGWPRSHKCGRKAVAKSEDGKPVCKIHSLEYREKAAKAAEIRDIQSLAEISYSWHGKSFFDALLQIAQGHNNPRERAREAIKILTGDE